MAASSATRVRDVHERLTQRNDEKGVGAVWTAIFDIPVGHVKKEDWTMEAAMAFRAEVDHIREVLDELGVPASATASVFKRLKDVASPTTFSHSWESQKKFIVAPECGLVLEWAVWALRDHAEPEVAAEHFETIEEQLKGLEEALATTEMSPALRAFIQAQVDEIREAMRLYPVVGIRALDKAVEAATGAFAVQRRAIAEDINQKSPGCLLYTSPSPRD